MNTSFVELLVIGFGLWLAVKYLWTGISITILPLGHYVAQDLPTTKYQVYAWLLTVLIFMIILTIRWTRIHDREGNRRTL